MPSKKIDFAAYRKKAESMEPPPPGQYTVQCMDSEVKTTSTGKEMIKCRYRIVEGPEEGASIFNQYVWTPDNPKAIGMFFHNVECHGVNLDNFGDLERISARMVGSKIKVTINHREYNDNIYSNLVSIQAIADPRRQVRGTGAPRQPKPPPTRPDALND